MKAIIAALVGLASSSALGAVQSPIDCFQASNTALERYDVTETQRARLCSGAKSDAPIRCFLAAKGSFSNRYVLTHDEIATMCAGAQTYDTPLRCVVAAVSINRGVNELDSSLLARLCAGSTSETGPAGCFKATGRFELTAEDRATLCAGSR